MKVNDIRAAFRRTVPSLKIEFDEMEVEGIATETLKGIEELVKRD